MKNFNIKKFSENAELIRSNERYNVYDLKLEHLTVSMTLLHKKQETTGHSHENIEEVYLCLSGNGRIQIDDEIQKFEKNSLVVIPIGKFHKVFNDSEKDMTFLAIFEKYERK